MRKSLRTVAMTAALSAVALCASSSAMASAPTGDHAKFAKCPYTNVNVQACVYSTITSGSFKLGNANVPITAPITLQGGTGTTLGQSASIWFNAVGADSLSKTPLKVPGGLIGLVDTGGFSGALISLFNAAVASVNDVYATAELAGSPVLDYGNILAANGTGLKLPLKIHLTNPFLGSDCYIGTTSNPVTLNLTTGTTAPPAPNTPITGNPGALGFSTDGTILISTGVKLVDNAFAAPAATLFACGYLPLDRLIITAAVNLKEGLPSAAGKNTAIQQGDTYIGYVDGVRASVH
jgi:hypothetical protein